jgi:hypothetical protein
MTAKLEDAETERLLKAVNDSGFPLQLGLASLAHGREWRVILTEHAWQDPLSEHEKATKFIDLVIAGRSAQGPIRLVVEAKRARDTEWIFLREPSAYENNNSRTRLRARMAASHSGISSPIDDWVDVQCIPGSPEADYCVIRKNNQRSEELLEKTAAQIARATEALAHQEWDIHVRPTTRPSSLSQGFSRLYVPIIVTTARMFISDANYNEVDLSTGDVPGGIQAPAPVVRFTKSLGLGNPTLAAVSSIEEFAEQSERSVLVVEADTFVKDFLSRFDLGRTTTEANLMKALYYK